LRQKHPRPPAPSHFSVCKFFCRKFFAEGKQSKGSETPLNGARERWRQMQPIQGWATRSASFFVLFLGSFVAIQSRSSGLVKVAAPGTGALRSQFENSLQSFAHTNCLASAPSRRRSAETPLRGSFAGTNRFAVAPDCDAGAGIGIQLERRLSHVRFGLNALGKAARRRERIK